MASQVNDIKEFRQLVKQIAPLLSPEKLRLLERIEAGLSGTGHLPVPHSVKKKKPSHKDLVAQYSRI